MSDSKAKITAMKANRSCPHVRKYLLSYLDTYTMHINIVENWVC